MKQAEAVEVTQTEIDAILVLAKASFPAQQYELLERVLGTFTYVMSNLENAKTSLARLRQMLFGKRTESRANILKAIGCDAGTGGSEQAAGAIEGVSGDPPVPQDQVEDIAVKPKKSKGHGRNGADAYRTAKIVDIDLPDLKSGDPCPQCLDGTVYTSPPKIVVRVVGQTPLAATVYRQLRVRCRICDFVSTAPMLEGVSPSKYDHSCASMLALLRYGSGMPSHRLERLQAGMHIPVPDSTQWDIVRKTVEEGPRQVYEELIKQAAQGTVLHNDDTKARILDLMGERRAKAEAAGNELPTTKAINTTGIVSVLGAHKVILFMTGPAHAGSNLEKVLAHRASELGPPIQMCDALSANVKGDFEAFLSLCIAHSRRQFVDVAERFPEPCRHVIDVLAKVYQHDARTKDENMSNLQRLLYHRANSRPMMWSLRIWMEKQIAERKVEPNSGLGQAMRYMLKHWKGLTLFYRKAGAPLDNNVVERALKKAIIHRNNSLFYRNQNGADVGDIFMSIIYTCESCDISPFDYLQTLQKHAGEVETNPHLWLPWNYSEALATMAQAGCVSRGHL